MSCSPCLRAKQINACADELIIGTGTADTAYDVYVKNASADRIDVFHVTSDNAGLITLDTSAVTFPEGNSFEIWAVLEDAPLTDREELTFKQGDSTIPGTCITFDSIAVHKGDEDNCIFKAEQNELDVLPEESEQESPCKCVTQAEWDEGARPYKVYTALLNQRAQTEGLLEVGVQYKITDYQAGDDFLNVGALANVTGEIFIATGTTPASWAAFSTLTNNKAPVATVQENTVGNIVWTYVAESVYKAVLVNSFPELKTWHHISMAQNTAGFFSFWNDVDSIVFQTFIPTSPLTPGEPVVYFGTDGYLFNHPIEIRVYD